ncbi:RsiV family protein [Arabiibacter massiliensis]|uniref:RsiV family protein n=1 Tax=Arabiibacter massiliensis TaxID=1870985 RepID=UPI0009BA0961|nr:RsiV family protein [Arabiibacter massiliensis]
MSRRPPPRPPNPNSPPRPSPSSRPEPELPAAPEPVEPPASGTLSWESGSRDDGAPAPLPSVPEVTIPVAPASPDEGDGAADPPPALAEGVDEINRQMEAYVEQMREKFLWYAARKYNGYVGMDVAYDVVRDDDALLAIRFVGTLNAGGSGEYARTFTLDKRTGCFLELADLFAPGADYVGAVSAEVLRQMAEQVDAGTADYFIPGGIWRPDECFQSIAADQHFYIDDANRLVIVFDEYEVAPGRAGMPEFAIPASALAGLLSEPSILC